MKSRSLSDLIAWSLVLLAAIVMPVQAASYLSVTEAKKLMFPAAERFVAVPSSSLRQWQDQLSKRLDEDVRIRHIKLWEARQGDKLLGYFASDSAIGRDELFDYAVSFDTDAVVLQVEILNYKEAHGQEVHDHKPWRRQFIGKSADSALQLDSDISNISGATLSCSHLADGIRTLTRLLKTGLGGSFTVPPSTSGPK
ncbi:MAG: FMN-binding protein [Moraxellaceae bacterium]